MKEILSKETRKKLAKLEALERGGGVAVSKEKKEEAVNYLLSQVKEFNTK